MRTSERIDLWEQGAGRSSVERGLLLAAAEADLPLGSRNERILALRESLFGDRYEAVALCPACGAYAELSFGSLRDTPPSPTGTVSIGDYEFEYRLANSLDVAYLMRFDDVEQAERALIERCVLSATRRFSSPSLRGREDRVPLSEVPAGVLEELDAYLDDLDPMAAPRMAIRCPECDTEWSAAFDVIEFVWRELAVSSKRALRDVHVLARAYGWTEKDVLDLSPSRRRIYLEMVLE